MHQQAAWADLLDEAPATAPVTGDTPSKANNPAVGSEGSKGNAEKKKTKPTTTPSQAKPTNKGTVTLAPKGGAGKAQKPAVDDEKQPVQFESKGLRALKEAGTAELIDNVIVTQGSMRLEADRAKVYYDDAAKDVRRVIAEGNVKVFKVDADSGEQIKAFGERGEFDNELRVVVLEGDARLWRGADLVRGKKISYELESGWIKADRVAGEVYPQEKPK